MWLRKFPLQDAADDGDDKKGSGGGTGDDKDDKPDISAQLATIGQTVGLLAKAMQDMDTRVSSLSKAKDADADDSDNDDDSEKGGDPGDLFGGVDLEQLDRKQLAALILSHTEKTVKTALEKQAKSLEGRVNDLSGKLDSTHASSIIKEISSKPENADFWEWSNEIKTILKETPGLSIERAYKLAKSENPKKVAELTKKYFPEKPKPVFGLTPTSSKQSGTGKMTPKEAAEKAFDEVMGSMSGDTDVLAS